MGKGRDKKKKKKENSAKDSNTKIQKKKTKRDLNQLDEEEEDIESILNAFQKQQLEQYAITEEANATPPSRRVNGTLTCNPLNPNELILFGGEHFNGQKVFMYNDFFRYNIEKNEWKRITSPNAPGPRSSHQVCITPSGRLFLFGGEFVSPNETSFFHYKDFWTLDLKSNEWERLEIKGRPQPRSGHRMTLYKHFLVLFGGFYDTQKETKYYDDLWVFDTLEYKWIQLNMQEPKPSARSGFQFLTYNNVIYLFGGYTKLYEKGQKTKGIVHSDIWTLNLDPQNTSLWKWDKKRKAGGLLPSLRSGGIMSFYKGKGILFGGVSDIQESDESIESICHNDAYQYNMDNHKWYPLNIKPSKKQKKVELDEQEWISPCPRFNCMMCIAKNYLYIFGGILEQDSKELTLNDFWTLNLDKLNEWKVILEDEFYKSEWLGEESEDEDDSQEGDDDEEEDDNDEEEEEQKEEKIIGKNKHGQGSESLTIVSPSKTTSLQDKDKDTDKVDDPLPGETLRDYFIRTSVQWQQKTLLDAELENLEKGQQEQGRYDLKALRRIAFESAQDKYNELFPELESLRRTIEEEEAQMILKKTENQVMKRHRDR